MTSPSSPTLRSPMKVGTRLYLLLSVIFGFMVLIAGLSVIHLGNLHAKIELIAADRVPKMLKISEWQFHLMESARHTRSVLTLDDPVKIKAEIASAMEDKQAAQKYMEELQAGITTPRGRERLQAVITARAKYNPWEETYLRQVEAGDVASAKQTMLEKTGPLQLAYISELRKLMDSQKDVVQSEAAVAKEEYESGRALLIGINLFAIVIGALAGFTLVRNILRKLGGEPDYAAHIADRIAQGDLDFSIKTDPKDTSSLLVSMRRMRDSLSTIVLKVREGSEAMTNGTNQIAAGNQDLSSRTEQQASSLEETASSMEEMTSTVRQNAANARQADTLAAVASQVAVKGGSVVAQVVDTMGDISTSSRKVVDIISVIDGIAFQTNILALNAAVEAARAGEQGRGFAVVASEVRNLAQRSAAAAKEIKQLIGDSVDKVDFGSKLVVEAGNTMNEIVESVQRVSDIMGEITTASQEQEAGIEQINKAINEMDSVTQHNAALVEEAAAAAQALQEQSNNLASVVSVFKVRADKVAAAALERAAAPQVPAPVVPALPKSKPKREPKREAKREEEDQWESF